MDSQIFEQVVHTYGDYLVRLCYTYTKDWQMAEDLTQETFRLEGNSSYEQEIGVKPDEPTIIFYKQPSELTGFGVWYLDEQGQQVQ